MISLPPVGDDQLLIFASAVARRLMDLAEALARDVQTLLEVAIGGFWLALGAIGGSAVAGALFSMSLATTRRPARAPRRSARNAWR
jgi:hypothetical protein